MLILASGSGGGGEQLGDIVSSFLTEAQFQAERDTTWVKINGQDIAGSDLATLTLKTTLPTQYNGGAIIQSSSDAELFTISSGEIKSHQHSIYSKNDYTSNTNTALSNNGDSTNPAATFHTESTGGSINTAAGIKVNFFIKINN